LFGVCAGIKSLAGIEALCPGIKPLTGIKPLCGALVRFVRGVPVLVLVRALSPEITAAKLAM